MTKADLMELFRLKGVETDELHVAVTLPDGTTYTGPLSSADVVVQHEPNGRFPRSREYIVLRSGGGLPA